MSPAEIDPTLILIIDMRAPSWESWGQRHGEDRMFLTVQSNLAAERARTFFGRQQDNFIRSVERLSSGYRITRYADDVGAMSLSERAEARLESMNGVISAVNNSITMAQSADAALSKIELALQRVRTLAISATSENATSTERASYHQQANDLLLTINEIARDTKFNQQPLLDGTFQSKMYQVGIDVGESFGVNFPSAKSNDIGAHRVSADGSLSSATAGASSIGALSHPVLGTEQLTLTGYRGKETVAAGAGESAKNIAARINAIAGTTGVSARAETNVKLSSLSNAGSTTLALTADDATTVNAVNTISATNDLSPLVSGVNAYTSTTGITAKAGDSAAELVLTHAEGEDISLDFGSSVNATTISAQGLTADGAGSGAAATLTEGGNDSALIGGQVILESIRPFSVQSNVTGSLFTTTATSPSGFLQASTMNLETQSAAQSALHVVNMALESIGHMRAEAGAVTDRFTYIASALASSIENLTTAQSNVRDVEYAKEMAQKARTEIFLDAGASVLAQANVMPELAMKLLHNEYSTLE